MRCNKCQTLCDNEDAFCRKCGVVLAQEGAYHEVLDTKTTSEPQIKTVEVIQPSVSNLSTKVEKHRIPGYLQMVGRALNSETGKKLVKGATMVAISMAAEIASQAATRNKENSSKPNRAISLSNKKTASNSNNVPSVYNSTQTLPDGVAEHYSYYYEKLVVKRIIRGK